MSEAFILCQNKLYKPKEMPRVYTSDRDSIPLYEDIIQALYPFNDTFINQ